MLAVNSSNLVYIGSSSNCWLPSNYPNLRNIRISHHNRTVSEPVRYPTSPG
jgi:hypothetical protein